MTGEALKPCPPIGSAEWNDIAERSEWAVVASVLRDCYEQIPTFSSIGAVLKVAEDRSKNGWRSYGPSASPPGAAEVEPVARQWRVLEKGHPKTSWRGEDQERERGQWESVAKRSPKAFVIEERPLYTAEALSAAVAQARREAREEIKRVAAPMLRYIDAIDAEDQGSSFPDDHVSLSGKAFGVVTKGDFRALRSALSDAAPAEEGWRPIETAPKDGTRVICWNERWEAPESGCRYGPVWASISLAADKGGWKHPPTHWRPLPAPPAGGRDGE